MTPFELLSCVFLGAAAGFAIAALARWPSVGVARALALGTIGGLVGGLIGAGWFSDGPVWGELRYHPMAAAFAVAGGCSAVVLVRLLIGHPTVNAGRPFQGR